MDRSLTETITIRLTPEEKLALEGKMYEAVAPSMRRFMLDMCMNGQVIVNEDLRRLNAELRRQGNNLNQLTRLIESERQRNKQSELMPRSGGTKTKQTDRSALYCYG